MTRVSGASHSIWMHPGTSILKMGRKNADSLVGMPGSTPQKYSAAGTKAVDMKTLRFRNRPNLGQYSLFVKGFELDTIIEIHSHSLGGAIRSQWVKAAGWHNAPNTAPPNAFWRTLVADRGLDGGNPPTYYSRACQNTFLKGGLMSGSVNTSDLIKNERCSVIAQFCRRVQEFIWNKVLVKTRRGNLGLVGNDVKVGDKNCILDGCSVPVVLRMSSSEKSDQQIEEEIMEDLRRLFNEFRRKAHEYRRRVELFRQRHREQKEKYSEWEREKRKEWLNDRNRRIVWESNHNKSSYWEKHEASWASQNGDRRDGSEQDVWWWGSWKVRRDRELELLNGIAKQDLEMYHSLLQLKSPKSPWKVGQDWWVKWQVLKSSQLPGSTIPHIEPKISEKSKMVCDWMCRFDIGRLKIAKLTAPEESGFNEWKAERRLSHLRGEEETWNEPPNWGEFELFLKYGRRWKKRWQKSRKLKKNADEYLSLTYDYPFCNDIFQHYRHFRLHVIKKHPRCKVCDTPWVNEDDIDIHMHEKHPNVNIRKVTTKIPEYADEVNRILQEAEVMKLRESLAGGHYEPDDLDFSYMSFAKMAYTGEGEEYAYPSVRKRRLMDHMKKKHKDYYTPRYESLGECYVHGVMGGEAIAVQNNEGLPTQIFELRSAWVLSLLR